MPDEQEKTTGVVNEVVVDDEVILVFINSDDQGLMILPFEAPPFAEWMKDRGLCPDDLIGRRIEFTDDAFEFHKPSEENE
jgi:hypothetical protein